MTGAALQPVTETSADLTPRPYRIAVRALCEFTAKSGDLDLRFTPGPSSEDGIAGHAAVRARRHAAYQTEVSVKGDYRQLQVRGRADGFDPLQNRIEEIKTYRGDLRNITGNRRQLHWAQAKIYAFLMCQKLQLSEINVALVYYEISNQTETVISESHSFTSLQQFFEAQCNRFLDWADQEMRHRTARDLALQSMTFSHTGFRAGQRHLAEAVYRAATQQRCLMVQAPTGIGKTIGTLFALLKSMGSGGATQANSRRAKTSDKIFFLAAKTSGRKLALDALNLVRQSGTGLPLRVLELVARDKACEHPDNACHGQSCPLARGFYDRLPQARQAMLAVPVSDKAALRATALAHQICPYYLSQEMVRWSDVVVGDYNYYFDTSALLHAMTTSHQWQVGVLVDEAHNLIERARTMYTAELNQFKLNLIRHHADPALKKALNRVHRNWNALSREQVSSYQTYPAIPDAFTQSLQNACSVIADHMVAEPDQADPNLQQFYFDAQSFIKLTESFGDHSLFDVTLLSPRESGRRLARLCIRNVVPAPFLKTRFTDTLTTTLFSATLSPWQYYSDMLGMPSGTPWVNVESPFTAAQLSVQVASHISTRYRERSQSLAPIVDLMVQQFRKQPGNYFAFFSSFEYLQNVLAHMQEQSPEIPVWAQTRDMSETGREGFLARFRAGSTGIGYAVLGGAFAEAIDLPGEKLIGAFIATLGLPETNIINEQIRLRMQKMFAAGYEYTYLYPGLQKVVQAAGRVIRTPSDQGTIFLMDDRFARPDVRQLLPDWWNLPGADRQQ